MHYQPIITAHSRHPRYADTNLLPSFKERHSDSLRGPLVAARPTPSQPPFERSRLRRAALRYCVSSKASETPVLSKLPPGEFTTSRSLRPSCLTYRIPSLSYSPNRDLRTPIFHNNSPIAQPRSWSIHTRSDSRSHIAEFANNILGAPSLERQRSSMPPYGSVRSPSLRKMDNSAMRHDGGNKRRPLSPAYIMGDPFALATLSIAIVRMPPCPNLCGVEQTNNGPRRPPGCSPSSPLSSRTSKRISQITHGGAWCSCYAAYWVYLWQRQQTQGTHTASRYVLLKRVDPLQWLRTV